jgi:hypothetical protein
MATLVSPGVSVTVTDESVYASAGAGTVPLILIATAANKLQSGSSGVYAPGTVAANANQLYLISSQRDLLQTFGAPIFYSTAGTPDYGNQLNELGLFTAYQYLGIANTAYVLRADIDLSQMVPSTNEPMGPPSLNQYWLETDTTTWGIFTSNGNANSALSWSAKVPLTLTSSDDLEIMVQGTVPTTSASAPVVTHVGNLVINGSTVPLSIGMSLSDVASAINNNAVHQSGISATIYARTGKPDPTVTAIADQYYLRITGTDITTVIDLLYSNIYVLEDIGFFTPEPVNTIMPIHAYGTVGEFIVDAYSTDPTTGLMENKIWQKIEQTTLNGNTDAWWFLVGSTDMDYPGWGWKEAAPRVVQGTVSNPTFTVGNQCTISIGDAVPVTITLSATTLTGFVSDINSVLDANSFNAFASIVTSGSSHFLVITNYDASDIFFHDITTETNTTHPWKNAGIPTTQTYYGSVTGTVANPSFVAATLEISNGNIAGQTAPAPVVVAPGSGYAPGDTLNVVGGTHSAVGVLTVTSIGAVAASISATGNGYTQGDTLTFDGPNYVVPTILGVATVGGSGAIATLTVIQAGQRISSVPANPVTPSSTSGNGTAATVTIGWGVGTVDVTTPGVYTVAPTNPVSVTGGSGNYATFTVSMAYLTANTFSINPGTGVATTIYVPASPNNTIAGVVSAINAAFPSGPIVASVAAGNYLKITNTNNTQFVLQDISGTPLNSAGIQVGYVFGRQLVYQGYYPSLTVPSTLAQTASTNVWINTTPQDRGASLAVKRYNGTIWVQQNVNPLTNTVPMYSSDAVANAAFGASKTYGTLYARYNNDGDMPAVAKTVLYQWDGSAWITFDYTASKTAPGGTPANGTLWYNTYLQFDIMVGNGQIWQGYRNAYPATDPNGPIIDGSMPTTQSDGSPLVTNDIWVDSSVTPFPELYRYDASSASFTLIDNTNHSSPAGIIFTDARFNNNGKYNGSQAPSAMVVSNYVDSDAPNAELYPAGLLLFNTRYSTYNVKQYYVDYFPDVNTDEGYDPNCWVTASGNRPNGTPYMGPDAQRAMVFTALNASLASNQAIRGDSIFYNLIATPGYIECLAEMNLLNVEIQQIAFILADPPGELPADTTSLSQWASNANNAAYDSIDGLITHTSYAAVYYPWALEVNLNGQMVFVPPSCMALTVYAYNDQVAYPWFAPAGFNRGLVAGALSVGYLKADGTYQPVSLNQGQRDVLYVNKINPITFIPNRGLVVYGQKTLDPITTSLDRVNVARLINYLVYNLRILAQPFLFEPNDAQTRQAVTIAFNSFMGNLVGLRALYDFSVVCDSSNNTPVRIDRNELWVDIAIKPEKAIEFIYIPIRVLNDADPLPNGSSTTNV